MSNVIDIQERLAACSAPFRGGAPGKAGKPADPDVVVDLAVKTASADRLSRDVKTCEDAISLLQVTIDAADRITDLVGDMADMVSRDPGTGSSGDGPGAEVLAGLRDMSSECRDIALGADYMGMSLIGPALVRNLRPGLNAAGGGDIILRFLSPLPNENRTHRLEARDLSPDAIGIPPSLRREEGSVEALLGARGFAGRARDYFLRQSEKLKSCCVEFNERWEKSLGQGHRMGRADSALAATGFLSARMTRLNRASGGIHDGERLRSRLKMDGSK